ncbi:hypothetical protein H7142_03715 [Candidatus Saccharibacteria bacterium]|nr:hypothetical protein [Candidatus Saccharibacteria bacterium]
MSVIEPRPFMGREEFDANDPDLESKIEALRQKAAAFGSNVVRLAYRGAPKVQVFIGTNHDFRYTAEDRVT